jgi:hypothetical protein
MHKIAAAFGVATGTVQRIAAGRPFADVGHTSNNSYVNMRSRRKSAEASLVGQEQAKIQTSFFR